MTRLDKPTLFTRRAIICGGVQGLLLSVLAGRLYHLQVLSSAHYQALSDKNRISTRLLTPHRGQILDRFGTPLAGNQNAYRAILMRDQIENIPDLLKNAQTFLGLSEADLERIQKEIKRTPRVVPIPLKENLSWEEVARLELHLNDLAGVTIEEGKTRIYPHPEAICHTVGYVAAVSEQDLERPEALGDTLLELPGFRIGKNGIEKAFEKSLRGRPGIRQVEVNAFRRITRVLNETPSIPGEDIKLALDLPIQLATAERFAQEESGAAALIHIPTGEVRMLLSYPGFDNNAFTTGIGVSQWKTLLEHPRHCLTHKAISGQYAPGSTFKMIVALAALEKGLITPETTFPPCQGHLDLGNHRFHCWIWKRGGHGTLNLLDAIAHSCDVYFYYLAKLVGVDAIAEMAIPFGLGAPTGIEITGEKKGLVPSRTWRQKILGKNWRLGETYNIGIGQGHLLATPLQLAVMAARLASGRAVSPHLVVQPQRTEFPPLAVNPEHLALMRESMRRVVNIPGGTAYNSRIPIEGQEMAGKTGTSQVRRISLKDRAEGLAGGEKFLWEQRDHAIFVGFAPVENPVFALSVIVEHGKSGAKVAAPIAKEILSLAQKVKEA